MVARSCCNKSEIISGIRNDIGDIEASGIVDNNGATLDDAGSAPVKLYSFTDGKGTVGFIPSMTEPFCAQCDRVRITSDGKLLTCLFENPGHDIKNLLWGKTDQDIANYILESTRKAGGSNKYHKIQGIKTDSKFDAYNRRMR